MIAKRTVFVLGAGAHIPYGFPSGKELITNVVKQLKASQNNPDLSLRILPQRSGVNFLDVQQQNINQFIDSLSQAGQASIDTFLNANQHMRGYDVIGKVGIAQAILESEAKFLNAREIDQENSNDWFEYLFAKMCDGVSNVHHFFRDNKVTFITFNYDRLLEFKLFNALRSSFNIPNDDVLSMVNAVPIHHLYGSLGEFDPYRFGDMNQWVDAFKSIKTIHDVSVDQSYYVRAAIEALSQAEKICLLGFGFHHENIALIELSRMVEEAQSNVNVCRFGVTDEEIRRVVLFNQIREKKLKMGDENMDALKTLRNIPVFDN